MRSWKLSKEKCIHELQGSHNLNHVREHKLKKGEGRKLWMEVESVEALQERIGKGGRQPGQRQESEDE